MINENYFAANGCSLLFFDRQARRLSDERYGKYHADETSALPGGLSVILSNSGFFVPFYVESRLHHNYNLLKTKYLPNGNMMEYRYYVRIKRTNTLL